MLLQSQERAVLLDTTGKIQQTRIPVMLLIARWVMLQTSRECVALCGTSIFAGSGEPGPDGFQIHEYKIGRRGKFLLRFSPNQTENATITEWARMRALTPQSSACSVGVTDLQIAIKATKREAHALRVGNRPGTEREREQLLLKRRLDELERSLAAAMAPDAV